jgi:uncharacterized protein YqhQ
VDRRFAYGGQAVIEGVMIRGQRYATVACRCPDGNIVTRTEELGGRLREQTRELPVLRGMLLLWETMQVGVRCLFFSSQVADGRDPEQPMSKGAMLLAIGISLTVSAALFFAGPLMLTAWLEPRIGHPATVTFEGLLRLLVLLGYVWAIGFVPGVRRLFEHHGAEHMAVNAYEAEAPLTIESIRRFSVIHARCGTNFLLTVMISSMFVFGALGAQPFWSELVSRVLLIPAIAGIAYEALRLTARFQDHPLLGILSRPHLELQAFTTRQPTDEQIEVAVLALRSVLVLDGVLDEEASPVLAPVALTVD